MAKIYSVPADVREKEKIIGGLLTIGQGAWLMGGFVLGLGSFAGTYLLTKFVPLAIMTGFPVALTGVPFAFFKKNGVPLPTYIVRKIKFNKKNHHLINKREFN